MPPRDLSAWVANKKLNDWQLDSHPLLTVMHNRQAIADAGEICLPVVFACLMTLLVLFLIRPTMRSVF